MPHSHNHGEQCAHEAVDVDDPLETGIQYSLYQKIDFENLETLNEEEEGSGKKVFKAYNDRLNFDDYVDSDCDQELLFNIPFTGNVKLKALRIIGPSDDHHPKIVRLFKNRVKMSLSDAEGMKPEQEFMLSKDINGSLEYNTQVVKFGSVHHLSLHFPQSFGEDTTRIFYIGLKGEFSEAHRHGVTICNYESTPNMADHKTDQLNQVNNFIQ